jgi:4-hydroxybenzoate polyprenyltransferase
LQLFEADMDRNFDSNMGAPPAPIESPESKWIAWALWSGVSLAAVLFIVFAGGFNPGLLLGWAVGIIIAAMLMVFRR